jgi:hypothetical protein
MIALDLVVAPRVAALVDAPGELGLALDRAAEGRQHARGQLDVR